MKSILYFIAIPLVLAIIFRYLSQKPPLDYGTGTMFDKIANNYDFINRALSLNMDRGWRQVLVQEITSQGLLYQQDDHQKKKKKKIKILDLATGTADVAIELAEAYNKVQGSKKAGLEVIGIDPSTNMLSLGKEKVSNRHLNDLVTLELGDVRNLSMFKENTFDIVTMSFGIRNVPEKDVALCEIYRVLQKKNKGNKTNDEGGRLAILEFSEPGEESGVLGSIARLFIHYVVPIMGALLSGAPREYLHLQNSIQEFPSPPQFKQLIEASHCGKNKRGSFRVEKIIPMNFDSVHIYIAVPVENR